MSAGSHTALLSNRFQRGAVVVMDALGFKGIWRREPVENVVRTLRRLSAQVEVDVRELVARVSKVKPIFEVRFLSDTVVFTVAHDLEFSTGPEPGSATEAATEDQVPVAPFSVEVACCFGALVQARGALGSVPLAFRGAISYGEFRIEQNFLVGPAVDEAAEAHQKANAAIVWLTKSAQEALETSNRRPFDSYFMPGFLLRNYRVPRKWRVAKRAIVANPLRFPGGEEDVSRGILRPFGEPRLLSDVWRKKRNTRRFLKRALEVLPETAVTSPSGAPSA